MGCGHHHEYDYYADAALLEGLQWNYGQNMNSAKTWLFSDNIVALFMLP